MGNTQIHKAHAARSRSRETFSQRKKEKAREGDRDRERESGIERVRQIEVQATIVRPLHLRLQRDWSARSQHHRQEFARVGILGVHELS